MTATENIPVIIGSGLSGMVVSNSLAQAAIPHVLIGDPPNDRPRLGESIDPAGTLELLELYPEFDRFYFKKRWITVFVGDYATACSFRQSVGRSVGLRMMGFGSPSEFIHVDRVGFDQALYERVVASDTCTRIESLVDAVDYDQETDTVEALHLKNGDTLQPGYVFDCTNHVRLLGRALDIPIEWLGEPQRVVFTHYHAAAETPEQRLFDEEWKHSTNIVRLYADMDRLNGVAWAIPLGSYISAGISMPLGSNDLGADEILARVEDAYARRGMNFLEVFENPRPAIDIPRQQYFYHERAFGQNWLLAGPSYGQVWFPSSSGVGTSLAAAYLAPQIMRSPQAVGRQYQEYVGGLRESHHVFDRMIAHNHDVMTRELVKVESNRIIAENVKRVARLATMQKGAMARAFARMLMKAANYDGVIQSSCKVYRAELAQQTQTIFAYE
jgi:flavin-dependent dehydrogenase